MQVESGHRHESIKPQRNKDCPVALLLAMTDGKRYDIPVRLTKYENEPRCRPLRILWKCVPFRRVGPRSRRERQN